MPEHNPAEITKKHCAHDYDPPLPPRCKAALPQMTPNGPGAVTRIFCCHCGAVGDYCLRVPKHGKHFPKSRLAQMPLEMYVVFDGHEEDWLCPGPDGGPQIV